MNGQTGLTHQIVWRSTVKLLNIMNWQNRRSCFFINIGAVLKIHKFRKLFEEFNVDPLHAALEYITSSLRYGKVRPLGGLDQPGLFQVRFRPVNTV